MQRSILNILVFSTLDQLYISLLCWLAMKEKSLTKLLLFLDFGPNSSRETTCVFKFPMNVFNVQCNLKWQPGKVWPFWEKMKSTLDHLISPKKTDFYHCGSFEGTLEIEILSDRRSHILPGWYSQWIKWQGLKFTFSASRCRSLKQNTLHR